MKKYILMMLILFGFTTAVYANERNYSNGNVTAYLSGNRAEVVDNTKNICVIISVSRSKNSVGEWVYEFACNNKKTKNLTKLGLKAAITAGISSIASPAGAAALSAVATTVASDIYDDFCSYYANEYAH